MRYKKGIVCHVARPFFSIGFRFYITLIKTVPHFCVYHAQPMCVCVVQCAATFAISALYLLPLNLVYAQLLFDQEPDVANYVSFVCSFRVLFFQEVTRETLRGFFMYILVSPIFNFLGFRLCVLLTAKKTTV